MSSEMKFPCPRKDGELTTIEECYDCEDCNHCGTFADMLNESQD